MKRIHVILLLLVAAVALQGCGSGYIERSDPKLAAGDRRGKFPRHPANQSATAPASAASGATGP